MLALAFPRWSRPAAFSGLLIACLLALRLPALVQPAGVVAAGLFALLAHRSLERLSGAVVRGQTEVFIGALLAGVLLGLAAWFKYNAIVCAAPIRYGMSLVDAPGDVRRQRRLALVIGVAAASGAAVDAGSMDGSFQKRSGARER